MRKRHLTITVLAALSFAPGVRAAAERTWIPTMTDAQELERHLAQPAPADLAISSRFYYGYVVNGRRVIRGEILRETIQREQGIHFAKVFPLIMDGGCGIITIEYDVAKKAVTSLRCNGLA